MSSFHPMRMQGDLMYESSFPRPEGGHDILKDGLITLLPNVPTGYDGYFSKEWLPKISTSIMKHLFKAISILPFDL